LSSLKRSAKSIECSQEKINHLKAAHEIIRSYQKENLLFSHGNIWKWSETGVWKIIDDKEIRQAIHAHSSDMEITKNRVDSILDLIKTEIFIPDHQFDRKSKAINCLNGEIEWSDGKWELKPHRRENYRTTQIPVYYQPDAKAPRFEQFLHEIFLPDIDAETKKVVVLESIRYSTITGVEFEKFILLIGIGSNGKSVLLHVVQVLLGAQNTCAVQPSQFDNRFQRAHLHGKLANIITEIAEGSVLPDAQLKAIVSGEKTTAEHKHKPPFDFHPFCTCWFGANHMPATTDFSEALFRRAIILSFNRKFEGSERDVHLKEKLEPELSGILNMALAA
jgi:putative DNA primase/helicase